MKRLPGQMPLEYRYRTSRDGKDTNLLILLHGLGDSEIAFFQLGLSFNLPQTAIIALRAPFAVPLFPGQHYMWLEDSFEETGELRLRPDPTTVLGLLTRTLDALQGLGWETGEMILFGYGQGGTVAAELAYHYPQISTEHTIHPTVNSVISIHGPLFSFPTSTSGARKVKAFLAHTERIDVDDHHVDHPRTPLTEVRTAWTRAFASPTFHVFSGNGPAATRDAMPSGKEWQGIMRFLATVLVQKSTMLGFQEITG